MKKLFAIILKIILVTNTVLTHSDSHHSSRTHRNLQTILQSPEDPSNSYQSMKVPMSIYELSSPVDYATQSAGQSNTSTGIINIDPLNHDANYLKIAKDLKQYEDSYSSCLNNLSTNDFSDSAVDACVGIDFKFVYDDIDYEKSKILARADSAIRDFMIQNCYTVAGVDLVLSNACDLVEKDVINLLWDELNFAALLDYHRNKYMFEHSFMSETIFNPILGQLQLIQNETSSLLTELYDHRLMTISNLKNIVSSRTQQILSSYGSNRGAGYTVGEGTVINIDVEKLLNNPNFNYSNGEENYDDYISWQEGGNKQKKHEIRKTRGMQNTPISRFLELNNKNLEMHSNKITSKIEPEIIDGNILEDSNIKQKIET